MANFSTLLGNIIIIPIIICLPSQNLTGGLQILDGEYLGYAGMCHRGTFAAEALFAFDDNIQEFAEDLQVDIHERIRSAAEPTRGRNDRNDHQEGWSLPGMRVRLVSLQVKLEAI